MELEWLGTGSGLNPKLGNTSFVVRGHSSRVLLVDCGSTVPSRLLDRKLMESVSDVLITHMHSDHIGGIETLAFFNRFVLKRRGADRPRLHLPTDNFAQVMWENALKAGMVACDGPDGGVEQASLKTYFDVHIGLDVEIDGLPGVEFAPTPHVPCMENYGVSFANGIYYSGDTYELPPHDPAIIFQDCDVGGPGSDEVHVSYERLSEELPAAVKAKTHLVHLGVEYDTVDPLADGFAGFVMPGQTFSI